MKGFDENPELKQHPDHGDGQSYKRDWERRTDPKYLMDNCSRIFEIDKLIRYSGPRPETCRKGLRPS
jgi:hypothetical protein